MRIQVLLPSIELYQLSDILEYYNKNKLPEEQPLELLDRVEGGFQINIENMIHVMCDDNKKIKQLRWNNGYLVPQYYISFTKKEEELLYNALVNVLGSNNVLYNQ
jgi:hypothetical protein